MTTLQQELARLIDEVAPPLIDLEQLERLVTEDDRADAFDGECAIHASCTPIFVSRHDWPA